MNKLLQYCKDHVWALLGFLFNPIAPLLYLGTKLSFYQTGIEFRLTIWGVIVLIVISVIICAKLQGKIKQMEHGVTRGVLLSILPMVIWIAGFALLSGLQLFNDGGMSYWLVCGVFFIFSRICYIIDEVQQSK